MREFRTSYGAPCTLQRETSWLLARLTGTCGQEGRLWASDEGEKHLSSPRRVINGLVQAEFDKWPRIPRNEKKANGQEVS